MFKVGLNEYKGVQVLVTPAEKAWGFIMDTSGICLAHASEENIKNFRESWEDYCRSEDIGVLDQLVLDTDYILVSESFIEKLSKETLMAMLDHEIGHKVHKHLHLGAEEKDGVILVDDFELEADAYSASIHGKAVVAAALKEVALTIAEIAVENGVIPSSKKEEVIERSLSNPGIKARFEALA